MNKDKIILTLSVILMVGAVVGFILVTVSVYNDYNSRTLLSPEKAKEVKYNYTEIENTIIGQTRKYYDIEDFDNFEIERYEKIWVSQANLKLTRDLTTIRMEIKSTGTGYMIEFSHELTHHVLFMMKEYDMNVQESIAQTYALFISGEKEFRKYYGDKTFKDKVSFKEYYLILEQLETNNNFECLNSVWNESNKIKEFDELKNRFIDSCNINWNVFHSKP